MDNPYETIFQDVSAPPGMDPNSRNVEREPGMTYYPGVPAMQPCRHLALVFGKYFPKKSIQRIGGDSLCALTFVAWC